MLGRFTLNEEGRLVFETSKNRTCKEIGVFLSLFSLFLQGSLTDVLKNVLDFTDLIFSMIFLAGINLVQKSPFLTGLL